MTPPPPDSLPPSEVLRRASRMHMAEQGFPAVAVGDFAIATDSQGSPPVIAAIAFLAEADWAIDHAIELAEAEEKADGD